MTHTFSCSADAPLVRTTGGSVRGYRFDGLDIFKGIPYAKARRFHAPEPAVWDGVLDATSYGYVCPLLEMPKPNGEMLVPHRYWLMDEACQNLNIWTPALDDAHRPVLVWLHGGGYIAGMKEMVHASRAVDLVKKFGAVVLSPGYRLALKTPYPAAMNSTQLVRQYDILSNQWGVLLCQKEYQTNDIRRSSREWL